MSARRRVCGHEAVGDGRGPMEGWRDLDGIPATVPVDDKPVGSSSRWRLKRTDHWTPDGRCHSGDGCHEGAVDGRRFCLGHLAELARIRLAFEAEEGFAV